MVDVCGAGTVWDEPRPTRLMCVCVWGEADQIDDQCVCGAGPMCAVFPGPRSMADVCVWCGADQIDVYVCVERDGAGWTVGERVRLERVLNKITRNKKILAHLGSQFRRRDGREVAVF